MTSITVEWADLPIIDLSLARTPEGRAALAPKVRDAMHNIGFLYVINHGLSQAQVCPVTYPLRSCDGFVTNSYVERQGFRYC